MSLDDIDPSTDTVMTAGLLRLFKVAGCDPTRCHACTRLIKEGQIFKLVPHTRPDREVMRDEMCCAKCGAPELEKRDRRVQNERDKERRQAHRFSFAGRQPFGGYERPSRG